MDTDALNAGKLWLGHVRKELLGVAADLKGEVILRDTILHIVRERTRNVKTFFR